MDRWYFRGEACDWVTLWARADYQKSPSEALVLTLALQTLGGQVVAYNSGKKAAELFRLRMINRFYVGDGQPRIEQTQLPTSGWYEVQLGSYERATAGSYQIGIGTARTFSGR